MYNPDPKDIDKLFDQMSEGDAFPYREDAWLALESRLDQKDKNRKVLIWVSCIGLLLILTVAAIVLTTSNRSKHTVADSDTSVRVVNQLDGDNHTILTDNTESNAKPIGLVHKTSINEEKILSNNYGATKTQRSKATTESQPVTSHQLVEGETTKYAEKLVINELNQNKLSSTAWMQPNDAVVTTMVIDKLISRSYLLNGLSRANDIPVPPLSQVLVAEDHMGSRFALQLYGGPEWSGVNSFTPSTRGYKFGAQVHFGFNDRLELYSGVALSQKKFDSQGSVYSMQGGWVDDVFPMEMSGKCQVIEIPIGFQYYLEDRAQSGWYANAAMHTYLFASEWYGFNYDPNDIAAMQGTPIDEVNQNNANHHVVGSLHFGLGYQHRLRGGLQLQFQPYVQIPLSKMGSGKISVFSYGLSTGFRFGR